MKLWKIILCTSAMLLASLASSAQSITYSYDAAGNRVSRGLTVSRMRKQERKTLNLADGNNLEGKVRLTGDSRTGSVTVEIIGHRTGDRCEVSLYALSGENLLQLQPSESSVTFSLGSYPDGIYIVRVTLNGESEAWIITKRQ